MKPAIYKVMVLAVLMVIPAAAVNAQSSGARFSVPFDFVVNGQSLPAGDYFVEGLWWNAVSFHNLKGENSLIILAEKSPRTQEVATKLIFHRSGDHYILVSAELPNTDYARGFQTGKLEGKVAQAKPEVVEIAGK